MRLTSRYVFRSLLINDADYQATVGSLFHADIIGLDDRSIATNRFEAADWLSRPAWWWPQLAVDPTIHEVDGPVGNRRACRCLLRGHQPFRPSREGSDLRDPSSQPVPSTVGRDARRDGQLRPAVIPHRTLPNLSAWFGSWRSGGSVGPPDRSPTCRSRNAWTPSQAQRRIGFLRPIRAPIVSY